MFVSSLMDGTFIIRYVFHCLDVCFCFSLSFYSVPFLMTYRSSQWTNSSTSRLSFETTLCVSFLHDTMSEAPIPSLSLSPSLFFFLAPTVGISQWLLFKARKIILLLPPNWRNSQSQKERRKGEECDVLKKLLTFSCRCCHYRLWRFFPSPSSNRWLSRLLPIRERQLSTDINLLRRVKTTRWLDRFIRRFDSGALPRYWETKRLKMAFGPERLMAVTLSIVYVNAHLDYTCC